MKKRDLVSSLSWIGFGAVFCIGAWQHGLMGAPGVPGPGCLPFIVGIILIFLSFTILFPAIFAPKGGNEPTERENFPPPKGSRKKLLIALIALFAYGAFLEYFGYLITTFFFLIFVLRWIEPQRWRTVFIFALLTAVLSYTLFVALKVELPQGFLGI